MEEFSVKYPDVLVKIEYGNHEKLFELVRTGGVDLALNDQRRAFSVEYVNLVLAACGEYIEISDRSPIAALPSVTLEGLNNMPCILVSSKAQSKTEQEYYRDVVGFQGDFLFAQNLEEARLMVIGGHKRNYCAFW